MLGILLAVCSLVSGCADRIELEKLAHVVVIGLDLTEDQFIQVTFQIANPQVGTTDRSQAEGEAPSDIVSVIATDVMTAKELANTIIPRKINFSHLQTLIISSKLAQTDKFHPVVASMIRQPEIRREMNMIITREEAREFIKKNKPRMETRPHKYYEFMMAQWETLGGVPLSTLNDYMKDLSGELYLAIFATTERVEKPLFKFEQHYRAGEVPVEDADPVQMLGTVVIREGRMVGTLTGEETRYALMLNKTGRSRSFLSSFPDPYDKEERVTVRLLKKDAPRLKIDVSEDIPKIDIELELRVQLLSIQSLTNYVTNIQKQKVLEQSIEEKLEQETMKFIRRTQEEFRGEPFDWHQEARKKFWTWKDFEQYDFQSKYPLAEVKVNYIVEIESFGKQFTPPTLGR